MRAARTSMDLTQAEMVKTLGISKGTLCDIKESRIFRKTCDQNMSSRSIG